MSDSLDGLTYVHDTYGTIELPPLDEQPIWAGLPPVQGATFTVRVEHVASSGCLTQVLSFVDGRAEPLEECPARTDCLVRFPYHRRLLWRARRIDALDLIAGADIAGEWPVLSALEGLCERAIPTIAASCVVESAADFDRLEARIRGEWLFLGNRLLSHRA